MRASPRRVGIAALAAGSLSLSACSSPATPPPTPTFSRRPIVVVTTPPSTTGLYVSVAVDNHFHDIHPSDPPSLSEDRPFEVKNEGRNLHNVSVVGTDISVDLKPGQSLLWSRIGDHLKPGTYDIFCKYHASVGMTGKLIVIR
jgi:cupredoxin-like protein